VIFLDTSVLIDLLKDGPPEYPAAPPARNGFDWPSAPILKLNHPQPRRRDGM